MAEIRLPTRGLADQTAVRDTPPTIAPPGSMQNVVALKPGTGRVQLTKRPGLRKAFATRLGNGPIQGLKSIARASAVTSYIIGTCVGITEDNATAQRSVKVDANVWLMPVTGGRPRGLRDTMKVYGSAGACLVQRGAAQSTDFATIAGVAGFTTSPTPWAVAINPQGTLAAALVNYTNTTRKTVITLFDPRTGAFIAAKHLVGADVDASALVFTERALWIAKGATLHYIATPGGVLIDVSTTVSQAVASAGTMAAASSITGMCSYTDPDGVVFLYACFEGTTASGFYSNPSGAIASGGNAKHFRSGIYKLREIETGTGTLDFTIEQFGLPAGSADAFVEVASSGGAVVAHKTVRFSQELNRAPRGARPKAIACNSLGDVAVAFCNQGWGPTSAQPPDGSTIYSTLAKFTAAGIYRWEHDTDSIISGEVGGKLTGIATTYSTDCPDEDGGNAGTTSKNGPAVRCVAIDSFGDVYAAGRIGNGPSTVYAVQSGSGIRKWVASVADPALAVGSTGNASPALGIAVTESGVIVAFNRSNLWDTMSASEPYAALWQLSAVDGAVDWSYSITQAVAGVAPDNDPNPNCMAVGSSLVLWGSAIFTD